MRLQIKLLKLDPPSVAINTHLILLVLADEVHIVDEEILELCDLLSVGDWRLHRLKDGAVADAHLKSINREMTNEETIIIRVRIECQLVLHNSD